MGEGKDFIEFVIQNQRQENMWGFAFGGVIIALFMHFRILQPPSARNLEPPILMAK